MINRVLNLASNMLNMVKLLRIAIFWISLLLHNLFQNVLKVPIFAKNLINLIRSTVIKRHRRGEKHDDATNKPEGKRFKIGRRK